MRMAIRGAIGVPSKAKLVWERITFSRLTIAYFIFSLLHFVLQISFQIKAFTINASAASFLSDIVEQGNAVNASLPFLDGDTLRLCSWVPSNLDVDVDSCQVVWDGSRGTNWIGDEQPHQDSNNAGAFDIPSSSSSVTSSATSSTVSVITTPASSSSTPVASIVRAASTTTVFVIAAPTPTVVPRPGQIDVVDNLESDDDESELRRRLVVRDDHEPRLKAFVDAGQVKVNISGMGYDEDTPATLDSRCLWSLNYPLSILNNTKREDIVFISFQFWVLGMSVVALLNESIPHILASLLTHVLATSWSAFQITHTANFRADFNRVITNGACDGISILPNYWQARAVAEIPTLAFNAFTLLVSSFLTWKLMKLYGWQTFKRVGASLSINRVYKLVLTLSIFIQLSFFFMVVTVGLWLDQLLNSVIGDMVTFLTLYKVSSIITLVLLVPWLVSGWFGVRRELRLPMFVFLLLSVLYLGGWSVMFVSTTFRWTFVTWRFFSVMASASVFLTVSSFILGIVCRLNFGKGLLRYLNAHEALSEDDKPYNGNSDDFEKVEFPSSEKPIPTYSAAFGTGSEVPPPSQMFPSAVGPRFFNRSAAPFERQVPDRSMSPVSTGYGRSSPITSPSAIAAPPGYGLGRNNSGSSSYSGRSLARSNTSGSQYSVDREPSYYSYGRSGGSDSGHSTTQKRWVIE
ncbi:hypothetical protein AX16_005612 [Volvariella volvacea WC 439]|nr:hypothetical protein AX16_005612 [Volvariella volvacea WC 439]